MATKVLNTYHDLTADSFDFTTGLTSVDMRFELVYQTGTLGTMDSLLPVTTASIVDGTFTVASTDVIKDIQVYDLAGRLLQNYTTTRYSLTRRLTMQRGFTSHMFLMKVVWVPA
jgi:hypothetical protein